jgi:uncharacterized protein (DUF1330 family)
MVAYAIAHLHDVTINADILTYLERIDATLAPYSGRFVIHGAPVEVLEGTWPGTVVIIEFPSIEAAHAWYESPAYRRIISLRTDHVPSDVIVVAGVDADHSSVAMAADFRRRTGLLAS